MSTDTESSHSGQHLSPTTSVAASLTSMNTDEHNELYDHRQQPDSLPVRRSQLASYGPQSASAPTVGSSFPDIPHPQLGPFNKSGTNGNNGISFDNNSDDDMSIGNPQLRSSATNTFTARPSRLAHSMPHQQQLYATSNISANHLAAALPSSSRTRRGSRSASFADNTMMRKKKSRTGSDSSSVNPVHYLTKTLSSKSNGSDPNNVHDGARRRMTRTSLDSDDSHASRESQETEEDVCFPMQQPEHTRINGIDFDELEEFVIACNEENLAYASTVAITDVTGNNNLVNKEGSSSSTSTTLSSAALKYTPKLTHQKDYASAVSGSQEPQIQGISFGNNKVEGEDFTYGSTGGLLTDAPPNFCAPDRFSFFCSESEETIHAPDIPSLVKPGQSYRDLFRDGAPTWWLDCVCPTDEEMRCITKAFGIHPLTAEDIRMQETREKVELFKSYYFICFHTFENDKESEDFLEPINVYIVVFREGVLTFHFGPISHCASVRRRVRQLRDYVDVSSDWLCYALIDDITDSFAPVIQAIEYEADAIEDFVFMARDMDFAAMLQRIGESRRKTMTLMRLLSGKADVIKMFAKRCQDEINGIGPALTSQINIANLQYSQQHAGNHPPSIQESLQRPGTPAPPPKRAQPRADIALYLGDIQDHVVTMFQNLLSYEKIFSRSHANYLAQLQVESFNSNNKVTEMLSKVTMLGTILVPLNLVTGLFGMNVGVPGGGDGRGLGWFFGILGVLVLIAGTSWVLASIWLSRMSAPTTLNEASESGTKSIISNLKPRGTRGTKPFDFSNPQKSDRSVVSFPSKLSRYD